MSMKPGKRKVKDGKEEFFLALKSSGRYDDSKDEQNVDNYRTIMDRLSELVNENDMPEVRSGYRRASGKRLEKNIK